MQRTTIASISVSLVAALAAVLGSGIALAQDKFPVRPVTIVNPHAAGGTGDILARAIAGPMGELLGQNVIVELRPGAGGNVGWGWVARSARPDGYTLVLGSTGLATSVSLQKIDFDPRKDLVPVAGVVAVPNILVVTADSRIKSVADLIAAAKARPGDLTFGSSGPGAGSHLAGELFKVATGTDLLHVPYKSTAVAYPDLLGGRITMMFDTAGSAMGHIQGGKVRAVAVSTLKRLPGLPNVPTIAETVAGYEIVTWFGVFAPAATPKDVLARLEAAVLSAVRHPASVERFAYLNAAPMPLTSSEMGKYYIADVERWAKMVKEGRLKPIE